MKCIAAQARRFDPAHIEPCTPWHAYAVKRMEMRALKDTALRGT
jgi:hypothetical protein